MFNEEDLLPISALQHLLFCERQCALIHVERLWAENRLTVEGRHLHERAHDGSIQKRQGVRTVRGLALRSWTLGLSGQADVVEISREGVVTPVEYKRGRPKANRCDEVQLCAQAICLEEMLEVRIEQGALFYGATRRRTEVPIGDHLRQLTQDLAGRLHEMIRSGRTPRVQRQPKCDRCSLLHLCMPGPTGASRSAADYTSRSLRLTLTRSPVEDAQ